MDVAAAVPVGRSVSGFDLVTGFEVLPVDNPFWRFYRMHG
jgi:hypothetical protein